jgi:hypothetical protein
MRPREEEAEKNDKATINSYHIGSGSTDTFLSLQQQQQQATPLHKRKRRRRGTAKFARQKCGPGGEEEETLLDRLPWT